MWLLCAMGVSRTCTVCESTFDVQFRYQTEERDGGFSYYCSQRCLDTSQRQGGDASVACDACATRFRVELVTHVLHVAGQRRYACSVACRTQIAREARGARLGEMLADAPTHATTEPSREPAEQAPTGAAPRVMGELPRNIAIFNHKGGTGKTTTSVTLASGLARRGKRVLLVDTDAQGNVGVSLGVKTERTLYHVLVMGLPSKDVATPVHENLDLIPSNETLAAAELYLAGRQSRDRVLAQRLSAFASQYDHVIVDCSPSLSLLNQNALCFVDSVIVPVACDYLSLVGMRQVIKTVKSVNQILHHPVRIWGVLPTFFDARAKICHEAVDTLRSHFGDRCLRPVRQAIRVKEAPAQAQTLWDYAPNAPATEDYQALVDRVVGASVPDTKKTAGTSAA